MQREPKLIERRNVIHGVPDAWRAVYGNGYYATNVDKQAIQAKLDALDLAVCTKEDIKAIIGNNSWTELSCDCCGLDAETIMRIGDNHDYDARWQDICLPCVVSLGNYAAKVIEARRAETLGSVHESAVP